MKKLQALLNEKIEADEKLDLLRKVMNTSKDDAVVVIGSYRISSDGPAKEKLKELLFDWYNGALDKVAELQAQIDKLEELL